MSILIAKQGISTTVQDLGRYGSMSFGINPNGAMDRHATLLINILLGNRESDAVLEIHFPAGEIVFESDAVVALGGADFGAKLDNNPVENWCTFVAPKGGRLRFAGKQTGNRVYLAVKGGFALEPWLGSFSTNSAAKIGGVEGRSLRSGDRIELNSIKNTKLPKRRLSRSLIPRYSNFPTVRFIPGAEFELLTPDSEEAFLSGSFVVTAESNRMGYRLSGPPLALVESKELVTAAVQFGTVQLLPDGQLIVLMADHQTAGGYPRIANVITVDLPLLAQLGPNDGLGFHEVSIAEAEKAIIDFERELCMLRLGCSFASGCVETVLH